MSIKSIMITVLKIQFMHANTIHFTEYVMIFVETVVAS